MLGEKLNELRKIKGISQELLAERSNISLRTIQRIEAGATVPRLYTIKTLADTLGVSIEQLNPVEETLNKPEETVIPKLKLINFVGLAAIILPLSNVLLTTLVWQKSKDNPPVNEQGRKIISFQILWTITTASLVFLIPLLQFSLTRSYVIGQFPPTSVMVYIALLLLNICFITRTSIQLQKGKIDVYAFVPALF
jgi:XRE family transcriptional regulator, regulator of sulfur utilization